MKFRNKNERKLASLKVAMNFMLLAGGAGPSMMLSLMRKESLSNIPPDLVDLKNSRYNTGIMFLGVDNFLSAAVTFCHDVASEGRMPIVSVGSGDCSIERQIAEAYRKRFGKHLDIICVDPDPKFKHAVQYKYVDDLIKQRPSIVGHCAAFIIWPEPQGGRNVGAYDIEAVRSLQPRGVLTVYERGGASGSEDFVQSLTDDFVIPWEKMGFSNHLAEMYRIDEECDSYGLDNYEVHELAQREWYVGEYSGTNVYRMALARRVDSVNACPPLNWTCKSQTLQFRKFVSGATGSLYDSLEPEKLGAYKIMFNTRML